MEKTTEEKLEVITSWIFPNVTDEEERQAIKDSLLRQCETGGAAVCK